MSVIDLATTAYVANSVTENLFNANAWNFFTDGWLGRSPSTATDNSYELSLYELVTGAIGVNAYSSGSTGVYGVSNSQSDQSGYAIAQIRNNLQQNGGKLLGTVFIAPIIAKVGKKLLAKPLINPVNRGLKKLGISQAMGVKL
jgi:hypothetical protein